MPLSNMKLPFIYSTRKKTLLILLPYYVLFHIQCIMESSQYYLLCVSQMCSFIITSTTTNRPSQCYWTLAKASNSVHFPFCPKKCILTRESRACHCSLLLPLHLFLSILVYMYMVFFIFKHITPFTYLLYLLIYISANAQNKGCGQQAINMYRMTVKCS